MGATGPLVPRFNVLTTIYLRLIRSLRVDGILVQRRTALAFASQLGTEHDPG